MSKENFTIRIEHALQALDWADQILWDVADANAPEGFDYEKEAPWAAAQTLVYQAMCLLVDSLDGVETVTYSSEEASPVPKRVQPYSYLSARYAAIAERYNDHAHGLEDIFRDYVPLSMTKNSRFRARPGGLVIRDELNGRPRFRSFVRAGCMYALAAALIAGLASPSYAGKRHRHHHGHHHHHGYAAAAMLGLGMLSVMLIRPRVDHYWHGAWMPTKIYRHPPIIHAAPQVRHLVRPAPPPRIAPVRQQAAPPPGCLMIREYQTRVIVGGREVEAYGDACMQPDGSWRRGPPKLVPH